MQVFSFSLMPLFPRRETINNEKLKEQFKIMLYSLPPIIREGKDGRLLNDISFVPEYRVILDFLLNHHGHGKKGDFTVHTSSHSCNIIAGHQSSLASLLPKDLANSNSSSPSAINNATFTAVKRGSLAPWLSYLGSKARKGTSGIFSPTYLLKIVGSDIIVT